MQQQTLPSVEKAEPDEIVVDKSQQGPDRDIGKAEAAVTFTHCNLCAHRRVAVHVIDIAAQRWIGIVQQRAGKPASRAIHRHRGMCAIFLESSCTSPHQAELWIGIEATMLDPTAKKEILAWNPKAAHLGARFQRDLNFLG